jgi:tetratricopeptide (TPR) repeat protein
MTAEQAEQYRAGLIALAREEIAEAEPLLRALATELPDDPDVLAFLATAWFAQGRIEEALEEMRLALALGPERFAPNIKAGELDLRLGDLDAADLHFKRALRAADHGSRDAAAARTLLGETRRQASRSIVRRAVFPRWQRPAFLHRPTRGRLSTPAEDGGSIE